jgi:hypothetical protein
MGGRSKALPDVAEVKAVDSVFRISSNNGPRTTVALLEAARTAGIALTSLSVQSTTLDDVFVHYTGHQLRDTLQEAAASSEFMYKAKTDEPHLAIIERDLRRFRRSPTLIIVSMVMPLVQLVVLGYAFGGKVKHLQVGILDQDHGMPAIKVQGNGAGRGRQRADVRTHLLQRPGGGAARFARRQNQRLAEHPAGILAQSAGRDQPANRAGGRQHRPIRRLRPGRIAQPNAGAYNQPPVPAR